MPRRPRWLHRPHRASRQSLTRLDRRALTSITTLTSAIRDDKWSMWPICLDAIRNAILSGVVEDDEGVRNDVLRYTNELSPAVPGRTEVWETMLSGKFDCKNPDCLCECPDEQECDCKEWDSYGIATIIQHYAPTRHFSVKVLHQQCYKCRQFGEPSIETREFVKRVAQRLKVWNGPAENDQPSQQLRLSKPNHKSDLCEGCRQGTCHF
jgi:hypothetical protein